MPLSPERPVIATSSRASPHPPAPPCQSDADAIDAVQALRKKKSEGGRGIRSLTPSFNPNDLPTSALVAKDTRRMIAAALSSAAGAKRATA